ncbi:MAG: response regulator [Gammaproteobacteria bacterium]|jgi:DNA-binding response OmpR family regulator
MSVAHQEKSIEQRPKVLVVDDEPFNLEIMQEILEEDYDVAYARSGPECMEIINDVMPDMVLLDVNMPGMSGYEVCQRLKENTKTNGIPVTFVSALDTLAERLAGYEVGGDDYICKPFESGELLSRVNIAVRYKRERESLRIDAEQAMQRAMEAMKNTGDIGIILEFLRSSLKCDSLEKLGDLALYTISSMGLRSSVQIRDGDTIIHKSVDGVINQLERTVLKKIYKEDAVVDLGARSVFNFDHVSVLIKNMPVNDPVKYDSVKSNIALITEALELEVKKLYKNQSRLAAASAAGNGSGRVNVEQVTRHLGQLLKQWEQTGSTLSPQYVKILSDLAYDMECSFSNLGLTEEQEQSLMQLVDEAITRAHDVQANNEQLGQRLTELMVQLRTTATAD